MINKLCYDPIEQNKKDKENKITPGRYSHSNHQRTFIAYCQRSIVLGIRVQNAFLHHSFCQHHSLLADGKFFPLPYPSVRW